MRIPKFSDAAAAAARQMSKAAEKAPSKEEVQQKASDAFETVKPMVLSAEGWGASIGVDDGKHPKKFGYGDHKKTIAEIDQHWETKTTKETRDSLLHYGQVETYSTTTREHGARARLFGDLDQRTFSGALGAEAEVGLKKTVERAGDKTETFLGARGRVYTEGGLFGQTVAAEAFAGVDHYKQSGEEKGGESWGVAREQAWGGARAVAKLHTGPTVSAMARVEAGAGYRFEFTQHQPIGGPAPEGLGIVNRAAFDLFAGVVGEAKANLGPTGAGTSLEVFAGARMGLEERASLAWQGTEVAGVMGRAEAWVGIGAKVQGNVGLDLEDKSINAKGSVGVAVIAGGSVDVGVTIAGEQILNKAFGEGDPDVEKKQTIASLPSLPKFIKG